MVYTGPLYVYEETKEEHCKRRVIFLVFALITCVLLLLCLTFKSFLSKNFYVILPFCLNLVVAYLFIEGTATYWKYKETLTINEKEKGIDRFKQVALFGILFSLCSLIGCVFAAVKSFSYLLPFDFIFILSDALLLVIFCLTAVKSRAVSVKEMENPVASKWKTM